MNKCSFVNMIRQSSMWPDHVSAKASDRSSVIKPRCKNKLCLIYYDRDSNVTMNNITMKKRNPQIWIIT